MSVDDMIKKLDQAGMEYAKKVVDALAPGAVHVFGCGCTAEEATGLPISTCRRHDQRTREVKASAALMQMANALDEAGKTMPKALHPDDVDFHKESKNASLREAAKYAVKAAKALIGTETD